MTKLRTQYAIAALAAVSCGTAMGQLTAIDSYDRCVGDASAFARDEKLNEAVTEYLTSMQREMDSAVHVSRVAGMAGLKERSTQERLRADRYRQELQHACAHISQSSNEADQRARTDQDAPAQATQSADRQRQAMVEQELNRRIPGAIFLMNEAGFSLWLDSRQGRTLRRGLWDQAIMAGDFEQAAQMLRDYERAAKFK